MSANPEVPTPATTPIPATPEGTAPTAEPKPPKKKGKYKDAKKPPSIQTLQKEREHIESLFADRINFYLVFAAGVLIFVLDKEHPPGILKFALVTVIAVSVLMLVALYRTYKLVSSVLEEITLLYPEEPYSRYHKPLDKWLPNANRLLLWLPVAMTLFFLYALYQAYHVKDLCAGCPQSLRPIF